MNLSMPAYAVHRLVATIGALDGLRIAVLGASYRGGVKEVAFSGVFEVVAELERQGAHAVVADPMFTEAELAALGFRSYQLGEPCDAAIVQSDHNEYRTLRPEQMPGLRCLVDGRRCVDPGPFAANGVPVLLIGAPTVVK